MSDVAPTAARENAGHVDGMVAAVDLGSNSFHMVIARLVELGLQILDRLREPVRLAEGLRNGSPLAGEVKERALAALEMFGQRLRDLPTDRVRAVGTNTLRLASSDMEFRRDARRALGHPIEVISGQEEARLIYQGISHTNPDPGGLRLAVDIGGGSTEVMIGKGFKLRRAHSLELGCVSMSKRFFPKGTITRGRFRDAQTAVALEFRPMREELRALGWAAAIGSSGTINAAAEILRLAGLGSGEITLRAQATATDARRGRGGRGPRAPRTAPRSGPGVRGRRRDPDRLLQGPAHRDHGHFVGGAPRRSAL